MSVYSPGPWKWKDGLEKGSASEELAVLVDVDGEEVCSYGLDAGYDSCAGCEPGAGDARLIAAAPELLAMLKRILSLTKRDDDAEALIARVEGRR